MQTEEAKNSVASLGIFSGSVPKRSSGGHPGKPSYPVSHEDGFPWHFSSNVEVPKVSEKTPGRNKLALSFVRYKCELETWEMNSFSIHLVFRSLPHVLPAI